MKVHQQINQHAPVLLREVLQYLAPEKGDSLLDATAGYGGHAEAILEVTSQTAKSVLIDRDENSIVQLKKRFNGSELTIMHDDFAHATQALASKGRKFNLILADLGVSSPHLDNASRGFSFQLDGPLDMRMDSSRGLTAADIVNSSSEDTLVGLLKAYGEDPKAKKVAQAIVASRPISTTFGLANIVADVYGGRGRYKTHPATKTFLALRIVVNDELAQLRFALPLWLEMLQTGGRIAIISFHSLEDRIVKQIFSDQGGERYDATIKLLTKKPIIGDKNEIVLNPRARSAKLRVAVKK
jgi:16S rRNA (cytosine1402-N4)-methyltransferase